MEDFGLTDKGKCFMRIEGLKRYRDALSNYIEAAEELEKIEEEINKLRTNSEFETDRDQIIKSVCLTNELFEAFKKK